MNKSGSRKNKTFHFYDWKTDTTEAYAIPNKDGASSSQATFTTSKRELEEVQSTLFHKRLKTGDSDVDKDELLNMAKAKMDKLNSELFQLEMLTKMQTTGMQRLLEHLQVPGDDLQAKFEKSCTDYITVLEEIVQRWENVDENVLRNNLGVVEYQSYKKNLIDRNRLRAEKRRLSARIKEKRPSSSQNQNSTLTRNGSLSQNNTNVNGSQSTPNNTSSRRVSDDGIFPLCGESFFDKSPLVSEKNFMLQPFKDTANSHTNARPAFQTQDRPDIIVSSDTIVHKSSTPVACYSGGSYEATAGTSYDNSLITRNNATTERSFSVGQRNNAPPKTSNSLPDDGYRSEFKRADYAFTRGMIMALRQSFGLKRFRSNQHEAITAALLNKDCFILMPTGGGKSLCYQLPAIVTAGVTIVVSPLKSLIQDQVMKLTSKNIPAFQMTGETSERVVNEIYRDLHSSEPETKLLYVTPEKLSASGKLTDALQNLYSRKHLSRFVIDEAHCVSQWGHDFRPDYKKLSALKEKFPLVPMMALTATATPRVRQDIVTQLKMKTPMWFSQSFNRPNLQFLVRPKKRKLVEEITEIIKGNHGSDSGIIYCLSRKECDQVADELRQAGIQATAYHAGLSDPERARIQEEWIRDRCKVICATIAFGMGIDKADVRFVFHHSLPKSLEGYFQECGRAGRDGQDATCILFYSYSDVHRLRRMFLSNNLYKDVQLTNLHGVVQYCENRIECRRAQLLEYFGETGFDSAECRGNMSTICDNCACPDEMMEVDVTEQAKLIVKSVNTLIHRGNNNWLRPMAQLTLKLLVDVFKGSRNAKVERESLNRCVMYGKADENLPRNDAERLFRMLVMQDVLAEDLTVGAHSQVISYAKLGPKAMDFLDGRVNLPRFFKRSTTTSKRGTKLSKRGTKLSKRGTDTKGDTSSNTNVANTCYQQLVSCCKRLAEEHRMKPHHIFADVTLRQMADKLPMAREEMLDIEGVTEYKMDTFGSQFLELTLACAGDLFISDSNMTSDVDNMIENERLKTGDECEPPYWSSAGNSKSKVKGKGKFHGRKKKS